MAIYNSAVLSLFSCGKTRGLVLEMGEGSIHAVPVFEGYALPHGTLRLNLAGADLTQHMLKKLDLDLRLDIARDIKVHQWLECPFCIMCVCVSISIA